MEAHCREALQRTRTLVRVCEPVGGRVGDPGTFLRPGDGVEVWWGGCRQWMRGVVEDDGNGGSMGVRWWDGVVEKVSFQGEVWRTVQDAGAGPSSAPPVDAVRGAATVGARVGSEVANGDEVAVERRIEEIESLEHFEEVRREVLEHIAALEARFQAYYERGCRERALVEAKAAKLSALAKRVLKMFGTLTENYEILKDEYAFLKTAQDDANDAAAVEAEDVEMHADAYVIVSETTVPVAVAGKVTAMLAGTASGRRAVGKNAADLTRTEWDALVRKETESLLESLTKESEQKTPEGDVSKLDSTWLTIGVSYPTLKSARACNYSKLTPTEWEFETDVLAQVSYRVRAASEGAKGGEDVLTKALKDKTGCALWPFPPTSEKGPTPMDVEK